MQVIEKLERYCAYQERCRQEVVRKLQELGVAAHQREAIVQHLIEAGFLDEVRFARSFVRGKFRMKGWGRRRLARELKARHIDATHIQQALDEIDEAEYRREVAARLRKRWEQLAALPSSLRRHKLYRWALGRGYESELVREFLEQQAG